ncbi:MAG: hypothetical protein IJ752_06900 [Alphaproteobacteria bacterium]|nr:hypothetical protein [Alphaproteobacteria bacterium]
MPAKKDENYKITLYLDTPKAMMRPFKDFEKHNHLVSLILDQSLDPVAFTGHAFIGLTDANGKEERWGYTCEEAALFRALRGMPGKMVQEEYDTPYNEAIVWNISKSQYFAAKRAVAKQLKHPGTYKLFDKNCATVAAGVLKAAKVPDRPEGKLALTPHGMVIKKRMMLAKRRLETAKFKIRNLFNGLTGKEKVPNSELLDSLKSKPLPVPLDNGMKAFKQGFRKKELQPLDLNKVIASISHIRS